MKKAILFLLILAVGVVNAPAQTILSGGGELNPDLKTSKKALEKWRNLRVGMCVHWGPSAIGGKEIGWSRGDKISVGEYDQFYKQFNPQNFDANQWCQLMKRWGMRYLSPTAKHHDGFALWFSDYSDYDMQNACGPRDIMAELSEACKKNDIMLGAYYSNLDWYHPDWAPYKHGGPGEMFPKQADSPKLERYFEYMASQVCELISKYDLAFVQFDGEWETNYTHEVGGQMYRRFHTLKPDVLLSSRVDIGRRMAGKDNHLEMDGQKYAGDFQDRERLVNRGNDITSWAEHPWQAWVTIDKSQWSYSPNPKLMSAHELIKDMVSIVGSNGNYMINLGPRPDGTFEPKQVELMDTLGHWLKKYGQAIYNTRGGPYKPFKEGVCTQNGKTAWLMITDSQATNLTLPNTKTQIYAAYDLVSGDKVKFTIADDKTKFVLPKTIDNEPVRIIKLKFKNLAESL